MNTAESALTVAMLSALVAQGAKDRFSMWLFFSLAAYWAALAVYRSLKASAK